MILRMSLSENRFPLFPGHALEISHHSHEAFVLVVLVMAVKQRGTRVLDDVGFTLISNASPAFADVALG